MNKNQIMNKVSRSVHKGMFKLKKHSPEIMMVAGIGGAIVGTVLACKATLKVNEVLDETKTNIDKIHTAIETGKTEAGETYSVEDSKKDLTIVYTQTGMKLAKLYGPAVLVELVSFACIIGSNKILRTRNVALAAAYATVDKSFKEYRGRVVERFGKELDRELKYNIKAKEVEEVVKNEDGTETVVTKTVNTVSNDPNQWSEYSRIWYEGSPGWTKDAVANRYYLQQQQNYCNQLLQNRGYLFLNEVYELLGFDKTAAGNAVGWWYDEKDETCDNFVDFGLFNQDYERSIMFINGKERSVILDFNVEEIIHRFQRI
jgi:hypothetical protein